MTTNTQSYQKNFLLLEDGRTVSLDLFNAVLSNVMEITHVLTVDMKVLLKDLCGKDFWGSLTKGEKIAAGYCMVYMVKTNMVPLEFTGTRYENSILYRIKK